MIMVITNHIKQYIALPCFESEESCWSGWDALRRPLDYRALVRPETWHGLTRNPPSLGLRVEMTARCLRAAMSRVRAAVSGTKGTALP